jgi:hypothetical protein
MTDANAIEIPLSKKKLVLMLAGSLAFVAVGLWFVIAPPNFRNEFWAARAGVAGAAGIVVFGVFAFFLARKLGDSKPGLIVTDRGFHDNASATPAGEVLWQDVTGFDVMEVQGQRFIVVLVRDPEPYIARQTSAFKRKLMSMNANMAGSPISISANSLKIGFDELLALLTERLKAHYGGNAR